MITLWNLPNPEPLHVPGRHCCALEGLHDDASLPGRQRDGMVRVPHALDDALRRRSASGCPGIHKGNGHSGCMGRRVGRSGGRDGDDVGPYKMCNDLCIEFFSAPGL